MVWSYREMANAMQKHLSLPELLKLGGKWLKKKSGLNLEAQRPVVTYKKRGHGYSGAESGLGSSNLLSQWFVLSRKFL